MQALLQELELPSLKLLKKVIDNANTGEDKFKVLKRDNDACRTKILEVPKMVQVLELVGFTSNAAGMAIQDTKLLSGASQALETAIANYKSKEEIEYEARKAIADQRAAVIAEKQRAEEQRKEMELKKIKSIQSDVRERPVLASKADESMGRSSAAQGIFAGAGGKSSTARTFRDIGVDLNS